MKLLLYTFPLTIWLLLSCGPEKVTDAILSELPPEIYPDYVDVTIPVNVAPLNFTMQDDAVDLVDVVIRGEKGGELHAQGRDNTSIDLSEWQSLLSANAGASLHLTVSSRDAGGRWTTYRPFDIQVSTDTIPYGICYRLIEPGYEVWSKMGIYETCLRNSCQQPLIENTQFEGCVNCHSFNRGQTADLSLHIRGPHGATLLRRGGEMKAYNTSTARTLGSCVYPYWHPSGRYIAYSTNVTRQVFHVMHANRIEVFDSASDLQVLDLETGELLLTDLLKQDSVMETFPAFSADGRTLFFCATTGTADELQKLDSIRYNLCCISFDPETGTYGDSVTVLLDAASMGKSITFPRPSYDGRHLVYAMADYGQFSIWHHEADLYIVSVDSLLQHHSFGRSITEINSPDTESYHSWSADSRWMVFSSRRGDGLFTRPYFTHVDESGEMTKPFLLPQENPRRWYQNLFMSYNVPEFTEAPVALDRNEAVRLINSEHRETFN